jgi:uncharacterized protein
MAVDGISSLGHVVESLEVPLTEAGRLLVNGEPAPQRRCDNGRERLFDLSSRRRQISGSMGAGADQC